MKLIIARHAEPDYETDSLTEKGKTEAELLSRKMALMDIDAIYCSPLGRAVETASYTLEKTGKKATVLPWLREFKGACEKPNRKGITEYCWDWLPEDVAKEPLFYDKDRWIDSPLLKGTNIREEWEIVKKGLDELLLKHGYKRNGLVYDVVRPNSDTIVLFCHLGVQAIIVSYLTGLSPFIMLHAFSPAPSSVTTIATEERIEGKANFRILGYGDQSHLYHFSEEPSFAARFCELYTNFDQRH